MHKNDYSVVAYFENEKPKTWTYAHKLNVFVLGFLNKKHGEWKYINVYDRRSRKFLKRFYPGQFIPDFLVLFFLTLSILWSSPLYTFINGFNNTSTIPTL